MMCEEEQWTLDWMGTKSVFDATRPDEIDRVYSKKLEGWVDRKGKGRALDDKIMDPKEHDKEELTLIAKYL